MAAQPSQPPRTMSSRLLTMKFMQRAAAASQPSPPSTPGTPSLPPPSKRQRVSLSSPGQQSPAGSLYDTEALAANEALAAEDRMRAEILHGQAQDGADRVETKWYFNVKEPQFTPRIESPLRIVSAGFSALDCGNTVSRDEESDSDGGGVIARRIVSGRRSFGKFNKSLEKQQNPDASSDDSESDSDSSAAEAEDEDEDDPTGTKAMIAQARKEASERARAERKAKKKAEKAELERLAAERRAKSVNLNKLSSISGGGGRPPGSPGTKDMVCYTCNRKGHMARDCPRKQYQARR